MSKSILFVLLFTPFFSQADIIRMDVSATLTGITEYLGEISSAAKGNHNFHQDTLSVGMPVSVSYLYDTNTPKGSTLADDPTSDIYAAIFHVSMNLGPWNYDHDTDWPYSFPPSGYIIARDNRPGEYFPDVFSASSSLFYEPALDLGPGEEYASITMSAFSRNFEGLESSEIPLSFDIDDFDYRNLQFLQTTNQYSSETRRFLFVNAFIDAVSFTNLTSVTAVNAPGTLSLSLLGFLLIVIRRKP